jgi:hypothetical protein
VVNVLDQYLCECHVIKEIWHVRVMTTTDLKMKIYSENGHIQHTHISMVQPLSQNWGMNGFIDNITQDSLA